MDHDDRRPFTLLKDSHADAIGVYEFRFWEHADI